MRIFTRTRPKIWLMVLAIAVLSIIGFKNNFVESSSHREAPMIMNDPLADNTDVYAFRNPANPNNMVIIANFIPVQAPHGGPYYYNFGENIAYDIHIKNNASTTIDDIIYRFEFVLKNEDPTTFFKYRLGKENVKANYFCSKSLDGGKTWSRIVYLGKVAPPDAGPRSIESAVGLNTPYEALMSAAIETSGQREKIFCGQVDDPFFVDIGGIADLGNIRPNNAPDGLAKLNVHTIAMDIPIENLQKDKKFANQARNILDPDYVIGVWASASRRQMTVRNANGTKTETGPYVQVSRLGMPLTNEAIIPIGRKDEWNATPSTADNRNFERYFTNPELALYMDDSKFGTAVPGFAKLRIQTNSLGQFDFRNGANGLAGLKGNPALAGTALDDNLFGNYLLRMGQPRSVDILPIFMTGIPNLRPYQLATGKNGNPLAAGKPFINNFLPTFGDMLRVNMATPSTPRNSPDFSSEGLIAAAALGLADERFNRNADLQFIPNMDGFPNGRRLEDDVTRIELQAVGGAVLAAVGLWYDDFVPGGSPLTQDLLDVLSFTTGVEKNDKDFTASFPFLARPWDGFNDGHIQINCDVNGNAISTVPSIMPGARVGGSLNLNTPELMIQKVETYPNPAKDLTTFRYHITEPAEITLQIYNSTGQLVATPVKNQARKAGTYEVPVNVSKYENGTYLVRVQKGNQVSESLKFVISK